MTEAINLIIVTAAAIIGALFSGTLGWIDSGEPFIGRKFASTILRSIIAGITIAVGFVFVPDMNLFQLIIDALFAFLAGAGVDVIGNRLAKTVSPKVVAPTIPT